MIFFSFFKLFSLSFGGFVNFIFLFVLIFS
jgi:hypothetical protein